MTAACHHRKSPAWWVKEASFAEIPPGELSEQSGQEGGGEEFAQHLWENTRKTQRQGEGAGCSAGWEPDFETRGNPAHTSLCVHAHSFTHTLMHPQISEHYSGCASSGTFIEILVNQLVWEVVWHCMTATKQGEIWECFTCRNDHSLPDTLSQKFWDIYSSSLCSDKVDKAACLDPAHSDHLTAAQSHASCICIFYSSVNME